MQPKPIFAILLVEKSFLPTDFARQDSNRDRGARRQIILTNLALKALKPKPKPYKKSDGGGLFILVETNGSKLWRFTYRHKGKPGEFGGKSFLLASAAIGLIHVGTLMLNMRPPAGS